MPVIRYAIRSDVRSCHDTPDVGYDTVDTATNTKVHHPGFVDAARLAMPDIDAVTMATPASDQLATVMYSVPQSWPAGDYVAWVEANTEGDYNGTYNDMTFPTPMGSDWDSWAMGNGYAYRGQPSVVYSVPFTLGAGERLLGQGPGWIWGRGRGPRRRRGHARHGWHHHRRPGELAWQRC